MKHNNSFHNEASCIADAIHSTACRKLPRACFFSMLMACLMFLGSLPIYATPVLEGDLDALFALQPTDCVGCSNTHLDQLDQGLRFLLTRLRRESTTSQSEVCIAEASLARELAVLTFNELRRPGTISNGRWRELLKAKAKISGNLSQWTKTALLQQQREQAGEKLGKALQNESLETRAVNIHAAAQLSHLFELMAQGLWDDQEWNQALHHATGGYNEVVDLLLSAGGSTGQDLNKLLLESMPHEVWLEGQAWNLTSLPDDFAVGPVPVLRDQLHLDYSLAVQDNFFTVMSNGCGSVSAAAFQQFALELSQGLRVRPGFAKDSPTPEPGDVFQDHQGNTWTITDSITVVGKDPIYFLNTTGGGGGRGGNGGRREGRGYAPSDYLLAQYPGLDQPPPDNPPCTPTEAQPCDGPDILPNCSFGNPTHNGMVLPGTPCDDFFDPCRAALPICVAVNSYLRGHFFDCREIDEACTQEPINIGRRP